MKNLRVVKMSWDEVRERKRPKEKQQKQEKRNVMLNLTSIANLERGYAKTYDKML